MKIEEALIRLRDDLKEWVTNNLNAIGSGGGGGSCNIVYLTQAEYEALPDTKLTDDVEYRITDAYTSKKIEAEDIACGDTNVEDAIYNLNESLNKFRVTSSEELAILTTSGQTYTIQEDCMINIYIFYANAKSNVSDHILLNDNYIILHDMPVSYFSYITQPIRCFRGDVIKVHAMTADKCIISKISD